MPPEAAVLAAHLADSLDAGGFAAAFGAVTLVFGLTQLVARFRITR